MFIIFWHVISEQGNYWIYLINIIYQILDLKNNVSQVAFLISVFNGMFNIRPGPTWGLNNIWPETWHDFTFQITSGIKVPMQKSNKLISGHKLTISAMRNNNLKFHEKNKNLDRDSNSDLEICSLVLYHLSYPGSNDGTGLNLPPESNAMQGIVVWRSKVWIFL